MDIHSTPWEAIKEKALETSNLRADMSVSKSGEVSVIGNPLKTGWRAIKTWTPWRAVWRAVKASCGYAVGETTKKNLKEILERYIRSKVAETVKGENFNESLDEEIKQKVEEIFKTHEQSSSTSELIQRAHLSAMDVINEIQSRTLAPETAPQIIIRQTTKTDQRTTESGLDFAVTVITKAPKVKRMNIAAGGMKGSVLASVYKEIEKDGLLDELEHVAGSSVGSISAACMSCMPAAELEKAEKKITIDSILGESDDPQYQNLVEFDESKGSGPVSYLRNLRYKGTRGLEVINKALAKEVNSYLEELLRKNVDVRSEFGLTEQEAERIKTLRMKFSRRSDPLITFGDLALLHKMNPTRFKDLSIYVYDQQNKRSLCYSSHAESRTEGLPIDIPIVAVVRMSTAHPLAFKAVKTKEGSVMVDGGIATGVASSDLFQQTQQERLEKMKRARSNSDLSAGTSEREESLENAETLYLTFREHGGKILEEVMHGGDVYIPDTRWHRLVSWVTGNKDFRLHKMSDNKTLQDAGLGVLKVVHGDIDTLDFRASKERVAAAQLQAQIRMREQLAARRNQAVAQSYTLAELEGTEEQPGKIQTLSDEVLAAMLREVEENTTLIAAFLAGESLTPEQSKQAQRILYPYFRAMIPIEYRSLPKEDQEAILKALGEKWGTKVEAPTELDGEEKRLVQPLLENFENVRRVVVAEQKKRESSIQ